MLLRKVIYETPHRDANCAADDTNMLVPQNCDTCITLKYKHVKKCTTNNKMVIKQERQKKSYSAGHTLKAFIPTPNLRARSGASA